jgi:hypothetical protein
VSERKKIKKQRRDSRNYLARDFDSFKASLNQYGRTFFSDKISDFSENGLAGMFVELASYIGDSMSYYMDHQFQELSLEDAVEPRNIERLIRNTGVKIVGAAPSYVDVSFYIEVPAKVSRGVYIPNPSLMPVIKAGTIVSSGGGIDFTLMEDIDFSKKDVNGNLNCNYVVMKSDASGNPSSFSVYKSGICTSSAVSVESFSIDNTFKPFRTISLANSNVVEVISVRDAEGNDYYEVDALTRDTVFKREFNNHYDRDYVEESLSLIPAPRRFISITDINSRKTKIRFGGGSAESTDNDIMPDPSDLSLPLYGKRKTLSNFVIDPNTLLQTTTLGVAPQNTTLTVKYRYGGGISHNVKEKSIRTVKSLITKFRSATPQSTISSIRASVEVINFEDASGGENPPTINELKGIANLSRNAQSRMVTREDLIARVYTMPSKFGRVFRVAIRANPNNPQGSIVSIISRDKDKKLVISPDTLKNNLSTYLNESRIITDAVDIVDISVINLGLAYSVTVSATANPDTVIQNINVKLKEFFNIENFQVGTPVIVSDIANIIINTADVVSLVSLDFRTISGLDGENTYSTYAIPMASIMRRGVINCPAGSIFEIRYPEDDIIGRIG